MPITAYLAYRLGVREGEPMGNITEALGTLLLLGGVIYLASVTISGRSGFVRGDADIATAGVLLAVIDGVLFTSTLIYCQRLNHLGVSPSAVFGLRFPLYVITAGGFAWLGVGHKGAMPSIEIAIIVAIGLALTIPHIYALQKAAALISTMTISALTALGPFVIFALQMVEARVAYSAATLVGWCILPVPLSQRSARSKRPLTKGDYPQVSSLMQAYSKQYRAT